MIIQRLVITSFGNEYKRVIDFSENVNLIMASNKNILNEIRAFIEAMLFGQDQDDKKRYRPKRLPYSGSMLIKDNDNIIKVTRNFLNGEFNVVDSDGIDITENYLNEYGELALLPVSDSIYPKELISIPGISEADRERLERLKEEKEELDTEYNYKAMLERRDKLLAQLNKQKEIEEKLKINVNLISSNEEKVKEINKPHEDLVTQIDEKIIELNNNIEQIDLKINELKLKEQNQGRGRVQLLQRNIQSTKEQLDIVQRRLDDLENEERTYLQKLEELQNNFTLDREELSKDYDVMQEESKREVGNIPEPIITKLASIDTWIYTLLIILGGIGVFFALANPEDYLTKIPIFLISFVSVFIILFSILIIYIRISTGVPVAITETNVDLDSRLNSVINKYNLNSKEEFSDFYNNAKKVYKRIDDLKADLEDINEEIIESKEAQEILLQRQSNFKQDLEHNSKEYKNKDIQKEIIDYTKQRNKLIAQVEELKEEKENLVNDSVWKLKEENFELEEANKKLRDATNEGDSLVEDFEKLQKRIDRYETKSQDINNQIAEIEKRVYNEKNQYVNSYADSSQEDYKINLARQFGMGLQANIEENEDIPYIVLDPLKNASELNENLLVKLKKFIENHQTLVFSSSFTEQEVFKNINLKHNGIFLLESN